MKRFIVICVALFAPAIAAAAVLNSGEWFINDDPGHGAGTTYALPATPTATASVVIPASALNSLNVGIHLLGTRLRDGAGQWGHVVWRPFYKDAAPRPALLASGEWFINDDPGHGAGTTFSLPAVASTQASVTIPASIVSALDAGIHLLGTRLRDAAGQWGHVVWRPFYRDEIPAPAPAVVSIEYRICRNGAVISTGTAAAIDGAIPSTFRVANHQAGLLPDANHLLQIIPIDAAGRRGFARNAEFTFQRYSKFWQEKHFTATERANPAISGDDKDPDKDGLTNLQERFFALNPRTSSDAALAAPGITKLAATPALTLTFRVPAGGSVGADGIYRTSDLRYSLLQNTSLGIWDPTPASWITGWSLTEADNGAARLQLQVTADGAPKRFFTLRGEQ
jgi:hypothetical protein